MSAKKGAEDRMSAAICGCLGPLEAELIEDLDQLKRQAGIPGTVDFSEGVSAADNCLSHLRTISRFVKRP